MEIVKKVDGDYKKLKNSCQRYSNGRRLSFGNIRESLISKKTKNQKGAFFGNEHF